MGAGETRRAIEAAAQAIPWRGPAQTAKEARWPVLRPLVRAADGEPRGPWPTLMTAEQGKARSRSPRGKLPTRPRSSSGSPEEGKAPVRGRDPGAPGRQSGIPGCLRQPVGSGSRAITPWNFPLAMITPQGGTRPLAGPACNFRLQAREPRRPYSALAAAALRGRRAPGVPAGRCST